MSERTVVKQSSDGFATLYSDGTIKLKGLRWSYPHLLVPFEGENDDGKKVKKYGVVGLMPKKTHGPAKNLLTAEIDRMCKEAKITVAADKKFLRNGDDSGKPDYEGYYTVSTSETRKPKVRGRDGKSVLTEADAEKVYGGCWGTLLIRPWTMINNYGKRINSGIVAAQFVRDDEPFGDGARITDDDIDESFEDESQGWEDDESDGL